MKVENFSELDQKMMARALELAARGVGQVSPGPLVGTVIVDPAGEIVGEGFYLYDQVKHAETVALEQAGERTRGATAYISLEPHAHHGRTPPCTEALIRAGIKRVVAPIEDPNPQVSGRGFAHLREAGVEVAVGLLAAASSRVNEAYAKLMRVGRPFVHLKMAVSLDGKVATRTGDSRWITGEAARARGHALRHRYDAIMVGGGTVATDDPLLTDRSGNRRRRSLVRVVVDRCLRISPETRIVQTARETPVLVFTRSDADPVRADQLRSAGVEIVAGHDLANGLAKVFDELARRSIQSVLVEGGSTLAGLLLDQRLIDKISFFVAPAIIGGDDAPSAIGGVGAEKMSDVLQLEQVEVSRWGRDLEVTAYLP